MHLEPVHYYRTSSAFDSVAHKMTSQICVFQRRVRVRFREGRLSSFWLAISALQIFFFFFFFGGGDYFKENEYHSLGGEQFPPPPPPPRGAATVCMCLYQVLAFQRWFCCTWDFLSLQITHPICCAYTPFPTHTHTHTHTLKSLTVLLLDLEMGAMCTIWTTLNPLPLRMIPAKLG